MVSSTSKKQKMGKRISAETFVLLKTLEYLDLYKQDRYFIEYLDGLRGDQKVKLDTLIVYRGDLASATPQGTDPQSEHKIMHQSKFLSKYPSAADALKFVELLEEKGFLGTCLDGSITTIHGVYSREKHKSIPQLKDYASDAAALKFSALFAALDYALKKYSHECHAHSNIVNNCNVYSEKTNENFRNKNLVLKDHRATSQTQAKDFEMQQSHEDAKHEYNTDSDTEVEIVSSINVINSIRFLLVYSQHFLLEERPEESSVSLTLLAKLLEAQCSRSVSVNTFDDGTHQHHSANNFIPSIDSTTDFEVEYLLNRILQSADDSASEMNTLIEAYLLIRCTAYGFQAWLKSGVSMDIGKCFEKLRGLINQYSTGGLISEVISSSLAHSLTADDIKKDQVPVVQDSFSDPVIESSPAVPEVKPKLGEQEPVNSLRNKENLPEMILAQDIRRNDITRPYGIPVPVTTECSTEAQPKTLCVGDPFANAGQTREEIPLENAKIQKLAVGDPTANAAQIREESSNLSDYSHTPLPLEDSDTKSPEHNSEPELSCSSTALLKGQSAEQLQKGDQAKRLETETKVEETTSPKYSADEVRKDHSAKDKDSDLGKNANLASAHYTGDSDGEFKETSLEEGLSDVSNQIHETLDTDCSDQTQGDIMSDTLETGGTPVQNTQDYMQPSDMHVFSDLLAMSDGRQVEIYNASDARVFQAPIQANSPENSGLYLCHENGYCYEGLSDSSSQAESDEKSNSSYSTSNRSTDQYTAQDKLCEAMPEKRSSQSSGFRESFCSQEENCTVRTQDLARPSETSGHLTPITAVQEQSRYVYAGQEPGCCPHNIIAHPTDEIPPKNISSSIPHSPFFLTPSSGAAFNALAPSQFAPAFGARHQASLAPPHGDPDRGVQPTLIVRAAGSRPPRTVAGQDLLDISHARYPDYTDLRARRATYDRTWDLMDSEADPASMALAGFFRPDPQRHRCVRCFYCGLELDFDGPSGWEEHLRHSPSCRYLRVMGGEQFVREQQIRRTSK